MAIQSGSLPAAPSRTGAITICDFTGSCSTFLNATHRSSQEKKGWYTLLPGVLINSFSFPDVKSRAVILLGGLSSTVRLYFWSRTTDPLDENPLAVQDSQICSGSPPVAGIMKPQRRGSPDSRRPVLQSRLKMTFEPSGEIVVWPPLPGRRPVWSRKCSAPLLRSLSTMMFDLPGME